MTTTGILLHYIMIYTISMLRAVWVTSADTNQRKLIVFIVHRVRGLKEYNRMRQPRFANDITVAYFSIY